MVAKVIYRHIKWEDIDGIISGFVAQGWEKPRAVIEGYVTEQEQGVRLVVVAEVDGQMAGYVTLLRKAVAVPFTNQEMPEIKDFVVFEKYQSQGIGNQLLAGIEKEAAAFANEICLGVGLHAGYGAAQRLYVKRGYVPDGTGIWSGRVPAKPYAMVENDDELVMYLSKKLSECKEVKDDEH
ncbi:MAG: GNAT family N-acetyltransferase [Turicibacter sp.]|nr:GNAT family N-acetyltransferase [Turicibacter sp.]